MITDPLFYLLAVLAVLITGISKGGFGGGLTVMAVPLMALVIPPFQAAAIMLPILCLMDLTGLAAYWRRWDLRSLRIMIPGALVGILLGTLTVRWVSEDMLRILIGLIAVSFAVNHWLGGRERYAGYRPGGVAAGRFWGAATGFTSFAAHAGGPPAAIYLLPQRMDKTLFVGTTVVLFTLVNYVKLIPYAWLGQFHVGNLMTALVLLPLAPLGILLGVWLHRRISTLWFYRICYVLLFVTGLRLLWHGGGNALGLR